MGGAASAPTISKEQAQKLCPPQRWAEVESKWSQLADADGTVASPKAFVTASKLNLGIPGTEVDMSNVGVRALMRFTMDQSQYGNLAEIFRKKDDLDEGRRERIHAAARKALEDFEKMPQAEKAQARKQGDLDAYTEEAQRAREVLFVEHAGVNHQLERWWTAAFLYLDKDWNEHLDWAEYQEFYRRLLRLMEGRDQMSEAEASETMRADFLVDAGDDGLVSHEEFRYAVFQLADTWTLSLDAEEYVEFLRKSYDVVFKDLVENDILKPPESWKATLRKGSLVRTALNEAKATNAISEVIVAKLKADASADARGKDRQPFPQFVLKFFEQSHGVGSKQLLKHFVMFVNGVFQLIDDPSSQFHDYALTFGQMAGIHTDSGRVVAFPDTASKFMLDYFAALKPIVSLHRGEKITLTTALERCVTKGETAGYFGFVVAADARRLLLDILKRVLEVTERDAIYVAALLAFDNLCSVRTITQNKCDYDVALSTSMQLVALSGVISASVAEERSRATEALDPLEFGRQLVEDAAKPATQARRASLDPKLTNPVNAKHEAKAFGDRADVRKASLNMGSASRRTFQKAVRKKRSSRTNLDADGSITAFAEAAQAALAAGANDAAAAAAADDPDSGPPSATGSPKQSAPRSPRPASES